MAIVVTTISVLGWAIADFTGALTYAVNGGATALLSGGIGIAIGSVNPSGHIGIMPSMVVGSLVRLVLLAFKRLA